MDHDSNLSPPVASFADHKKHRDEIARLQQAECIGYHMHISGDVDHLDQLDCLIAEIASLGVYINLVTISADGSSKELTADND
jgi:hypothetical protein